MMLTVEQGLIASQVVSDGSQAILARTGFINSLHELVGWNTVSDASGDEYQLGQSVTPHQNLTLYATWSDTYQFDGNGSDGGTAPAQVESATGVPAPPACTFTRNGYDFAGWSDTTSGQGQVIAAGSVFMRPWGAGGRTIVLYTQWTPQPVTPQPVTPLPVTLQPVTPLPVIPQPVTPLPVTTNPAPTAPAPIVPATTVPLPTPQTSIPLTESPVTSDKQIPHVFDPAQAPTPVTGLQEPETPEASKQSQTLPRTGDISVISIILLLCVGACGAVMASYAWKCNARANRSE